MTQARDKANIPVLNFASKGIDDNADATAITISSAENVGIGGAAISTQRLAINGDGSNIIGGIEFRNAASGGSTASIGMASGTSNALSIAVNDAANMVFKNSSGTERMRIPSGGGLLVGKTSGNIATAGFEISSGGDFSATKSGSTIAQFNRLTNDGDVFRIKKVSHV